MDNTWLSVERLASFVASVCDATRSVKNAWRPLWRPFVRRLVFVVALRKKLQPRGLETMFCLWEEYEIKIKNKEKFRGRVFLHSFTVYLGNFKKVV